MDYTDSSLRLFYDLEERMDFKHERITSELMRRKNRALRKISTSLSSTLAESIAALISSKEAEGNTHAETIIAWCDLDEEEILALREDPRGIYEELLEEYQNMDEQEYLYG